MDDQAKCQRDRPRMNLRNEECLRNPYDDLAKNFERGLGTLCVDGVKGERVYLLTN
jgi:hypothetical protein